MEALQAVFKELYTSFLLRDFAGKIVPGCFLLLSYALLFSQPRDIMKAVTGKVSFVSVFFVAGLAWTVVLGIQSLAELIGLWKYYPPSAGAEMAIQSNVIERFLRISCPAERLQYERFVVIKEATGNLFVVGLLSIPAWLWWLNTLFSSLETRKAIWGNRSLAARTITMVSLAVLILTGLCIMNREHVNKQYELPIRILQDIDKGASHDCPGRT